VHLHVYEFVTGGGLFDQDLPASLMREALLMRDTLLADLAACGTLQVSISHDPRCPLPVPSPQLRVCLPVAGDEPRARFVREIAAADAVWVVAPESDGALAHYVDLALASGKAVVGAQPGAIALAASKLRTAQRLAAHGVPVVPTFDAALLARGPADRFRGARGAWVVKPDDGAGCTDTIVCESLDAARQSLRRRGAGHVAQPWLDGTALSLSVVAGAHSAELLSVNRQHLSVTAGVVGLAALDVNSHPRSDALAALADRVARAMPGLNGYFGVDLVETNAGPIVLEVNPRLTTSCAGLRRARGINVAARVLGAVESIAWQAGVDAPAAPDSARASVDIAVRIDLGAEPGVHDAHAGAFDSAAAQ